MINLLPYEYKDEIRAARTNVLLTRYIMILVTAVLVLGGLLIASYLSLDETRETSAAKVAENQQRVAVFQDIKTQSDAFRADLTTAKSILDSDISFAKLIYKIADIIPRGVVLDDLALDPKTFGTSTTITAGAKTFSDATKLKDALSGNNGVFSDVKLLSIRSEDGSGGSSAGYPVKVSMSLVINREALK